MEIQILILWVGHRHIHRISDSPHNWYTLQVHWTTYSRDAHLWRHTVAQKFW